MKVKISVIFIICLLTGCAHQGRLIRVRTASSPSLKSSRPLSEIPAVPQKRDKIVEATQKSIGKSYVSAQGKRFRADCSGTVRGIYAMAGFPLGGKAKQINENDVTIIHRYVYNNGAIYEDTPLPGDLVFFHDTYDPKGIKHNEERLTHIGIVESIHNDGTITFVHHLGNKIIRSQMNLRNPNARFRLSEKYRLNTPLRRANSRQASLTSGELFAGFGRLIL